MPKRILLRALTTEEKAEIKRLAGSRKQAMRLVQRARIIAAMVENPELTATEAGYEAGFKSSAIGVQWVKRFNESGLVGHLICRPPFLDLGRTTPNRAFGARTRTT